MPVTVAKWWGNVQNENGWHESEVDLVAYDDKNIILGECKYKSKRVGVNELAELRAKIPFVPVKDRKVYCLLASKGGFTDALDAMKGEDVILISEA